MKCGGWSQFDPKFSDPHALNVFMDAAAAAAANSRAALTLSPPVDDIKSACGGLAGERGFALTFSAFDDRHKVCVELALCCDLILLLLRCNSSSAHRNGWKDFVRNVLRVGGQPAVVLQVPVLVAQGRKQLWTTSDSSRCALDAVFACLRCSSREFRQLLQAVSGHPRR